MVNDICKEGGWMMTCVRQLDGRQVKGGRREGG